jgi:hypothetical protein
MTTVYVKPNDNQTYKTDAGIPFECVEFVRRYFMQTRGLTFPSVVDATDMLYRIHALVPMQANQHNHCNRLRCRRACTRML